MNVIKNHNNGRIEQSDVVMETPLTINSINLSTVENSDTTNTNPLQDGCMQPCDVTKDTPSAIILPTVENAETTNTNPLQDACIQVSKDQTF